MTTVKSFVAENEARLAEFQKASSAVSETGVTEAQWAAYEGHRRALVTALADVQIDVLKKVPTKQNEDTFGHEVQESVAEYAGTAGAALRGAGKDTPGIAKYTAYLAAIASHHKDKKDRPDGYPAELDAKQLAALESSWAFEVTNAYQRMRNVAINMACLLEKNKDLIEKPKRSYSTMM